MFKPAAADTAIVSEFVIVGVAVFVVIESTVTDGSAVILVAIGAFVLSGLIVPVTVVTDTALVVVRIGMLLVASMDCS